MSAPEGPPIEWLVDLKAPNPPDATHLRTTWITASQAMLRERGYGARYEANLEGDPQKDEVLSVVVGQWAPMSVARAHYLACDRMDLGEPEMLEMGAAATRRANATWLQFASRMAQGAGVTPWTILVQSPRMVERGLLGGAGVRVGRVGPKEAQLEMVGYPLALIRYNRVTFRGIIVAVVELFCQKAYIREIPRLTKGHAIGLRVSWV